MTQTPMARFGMWLDDVVHRDSHVVFRCKFRTARSLKGSLRVFSSCPFLLYFNGEWVGEGPVRWPSQAPQSQSFMVDSEPGENQIAIYAHYEGVATRLMEALPPLLSVRVDTIVPDSIGLWKVSGLGGFTSEVRRINPQFGWIDWQDTRESLIGWQHIDFDDGNWAEPKAIPNPFKDPTDCAIRMPLARSIHLHPVAHGVLTEQFGYDADDPPAQFYLRDLEARHGPPQGVWRRYDLGRVRLGRPKFKIEAPRGAVVEFAYSESLSRGRVCPWITLSTGMSANVDRFVARGGVQEFMTTTPKAGRFLEVHVLADASRIHFVDEEFLERTYHGVPVGSFVSSDRRLEQIWSTGVETYRACSEDSVIDNPTRERGEWIGDSLTVGLENAAVAYPDLSLFRKALRDAATCAREDGLVAGLCPGTVSYLSTYACHWIVAGMRMFELTGDLAFLKELFPAAERNMQAFAAKLTDDGLVGDLGWAFIDWGYVGNEGPSDMGLNLIYLGALRSMIRWRHALGESRGVDEANAARVEAAVHRYLSIQLSKPKPFVSIGLQRAVLALRLGLFNPEQSRDCVRFIKAHYLSCFPNDPFAPHLADPAMAQPRLITPFFSHFALSALWDSGECEFALDQYRSCWGWALDQGLTTWPEVFDLRWSHCHQWSGCPTWQLTRYIFGLNPRQDLGRFTFDFTPSPTSLNSASARIPIPETSHIIEAAYANGHWTIETPVPIQLRLNGQIHEVQSHFEHRL